VNDVIAEHNALRAAEDSLEGVVGEAVSLSFSRKDAVNE